MKKLIIGALVGAVILIAWSMVSWTMLPIHHRTFQYTPAQEEVIQNLDQNLPESGAYMIPMADNREAGFYDDEYQKAFSELQKDRAGKPWALVFYTEKWTESLSTMGWGMLIQFCTVFIICFLLRLASDKLTTFFMRWWFVLLVASLISIESYVMLWNWMGLHWHFVKGFIFDLLVGYGLCGLWLAWYFGRKPATSHAH